MHGEGEWRKLWDSDTWELRLDPVFRAYVSPVDGKWKPTLNGIELSLYPRLERAQARIDWEIWNRLRMIREGYRRVLERRPIWEAEHNDPYGVRKQFP